MVDRLIPALGSSGMQEHALPEYPQKAWLGAHDLPVFSQPHMQSIEPPEAGDQPRSAAPVDASLDAFVELGKPQKTAGLLLVPRPALEHIGPGTMHLPCVEQLSPHVGEEPGREHLLAGPLKSVAADGLRLHGIEELGRTARVAIHKLRTRHISDE